MRAVAFVDPMVTLALTLVLGIAAGAVGAFLALRPALVERRRRAREVIELRSELAAERSVLDERLAAAVKTLSSEALDANSARFLELADARLAGYVRPLTDSLERWTTISRASSAFGTRRTAPCARRSQRSRSEAGSLTNALRTPHVRGRWGESQLRNVVEHAGMIEHCDYVSQATSSTEDGVLRPDLVIRIPGGKHVVVDAKAPLARVSRRLRGVRRRRARTALPRPRPPGARARHEALGQGLLAPVRAVAGRSSSCSFPTSRTYASPRSTTDAAGLRVELERHPRLAEHTHDLCFAPSP